MTDLDIINLFEAHHPKTEEDIKALGLNPVYIKGGCARQVYQLSPTLAVKVVNSEHTIQQSEREIAALEKISTDPVHEDIRGMVPPLYYGNKETGTVLTKYYPGEVTYDNNCVIEPIIRKFESLGIYDVFSLNFRKDERGNYIVIDLGHASNKFLGLPEER